MESHSDKHNPENDHYSVDEMMDRLKRNDQQKRSVDPNNEGELITRPDGSQVIKVRKHKRRSKQQAKKSEHNPKTKWTILGAMIALLVILVAGIVFIIAKYNGKSFKEKTELNISELTGAEATELTQLRVTPISAMASKAIITWGNDSFYQSANFSNIRGDIGATSFLSTNWSGEELVAEQGIIHLQIPLADAAKSDQAIVSHYRFGTLRCNKLDLLFGSKQESPSIIGLQMSMSKGIGDAYQLVFNNGLLNISNWPALKISSGILTMNSNSTEIKARLEAGKNLKGEILIQGSVANGTGRPLALDIHSKNYPIQELLGKDLGRLIQGDINSDMGTLSYDYKKENMEALSFIMPFNSSELFISDLPMLTDLRELTGESQYTRPTMTHCGGTIIRTLEGVTLDHLNLISSRLFTLHGSISVNPKGQLSGELKIGIPARFFGKNNPAPAIFSRPHDGYIHTKVTLGGSIHNPHDDLNERLRASKQVRGSTPSTLKKTDFQKPLTPMEKIKQEAGQKEKDFEELTR